MVDRFRLWWLITDSYHFIAMTSFKRKCKHASSKKHSSCPSDLLHHSLKQQVSSASCYREGKLEETKLEVLKRGEQWMKVAGLHQCSTRNNYHFYHRQGNARTSVRSFQSYLNHITYPSLNEKHFEFPRWWWMFLHLYPILAPQL